MKFLIILKIGFFTKCIVLIPDNLAKNIVKQAYYVIVSNIHCK